MNFASDNVTGCCPEIAEALAKASTGAAIPYGNDPWTGRAQDRLREVFEKPDLVAFPVATGTAANSLALATMTPPHGAVLCHAESHINVDECGAPEMFTGGAKLIALPGDGCKLAPEALAAALDHAGARVVHRVQPAAVSISQVTEAGTVYTVDEVRAISGVCRTAGIGLHMDGARFANAVAALGCAPADVTWRAGVDALSFGATKNGAWAAEAVIFFDPAKAADLIFRRKRSGHLLSKGRFLGVQLCAYLEDDVWLRNARHANAMADRLARGLSQVQGVRLLHPVQANEMFAVLPAPLREHLRGKGFLFIDWPDYGPDAVRFVCAYDTRQQDVDDLLQAAGSPR